MGTGRPLALLAAVPAYEGDGVLRLILVRHGETTWNREGRTHGRTDVELSDSGLQQAEALARALANRPVAAVYSSPLLRARATAERIATPHGLTVVTKPELLEMDQGDLEGLTFTELKARHGPMLEVWRATPDAVRMPGGETLAEVQSRAWPIVAELLGRHRNQLVVAVAHNFTNAVLLCCAQGMPLARFREVRQDPACLNILEFGPDGVAARVLTINDTGHLSG